MKNEAQKYEELVKAVNTIQDNENYFESRKSGAVVRLDMHWDRFTHGKVSRVIDEYSLFQSFKGKSVSELEDVMQEEQQLIMETVERIEDRLAQFDERGFAISDF